MSKRRLLPECCYDFWVRDGRDGETRPVRDTQLIHGVAAPNPSFVVAHMNEAALRKSAEDWLANSGHAPDCDCPSCECAHEHRR